MSQYIRFSFRLAQDIFNLSSKAVRYIQSTLENWNRIENKQYWKCQSCGTKFDLSTTKEAKTCFMCRIGACLN